MKKMTTLSKRTRFPYYLARISLAMTYFLLLIALVCAIFKSFVSCIVASILVGIFYGLAFFSTKKVNKKISCWLKLTGRNFLFGFPSHHLNVFIFTQNLTILLIFLFPQSIWNLIKSAKNLFGFLKEDELLLRR